MRVVTLTTDFGTRDYYVGTMKGVLLRINTDIRIVDLTHEIEKQEIVEAAIVLRSSRGFFPEGSIHIAVVDPGVGGPQRPIMVESSGQFYIGPDNGIFSYVIEDDYRAWEIENADYRLKSVSDTFHGRDIFAPAAGHLSLGVSPESFGSRIDNLTRIQARRPMHFTDRVVGEVIHVDSFGNLITNVSKALLHEISDGRAVRLRISGRTVEGVSKTYSAVEVGQLVALFGSTDLVEIAVRDGNAHRKLGVGRGDPVVLTVEAT